MIKPQIKSPSILFLISLLSLSTLRAEKPNILILYGDDLGYGDLGVYNPDSKIPTPNLDKLAANGMRFTDGHSSSGICTPSRYALLTGRHHWRKFHGIVNAFGESVFADERLTLGEMLQEKSYTTAAIGKWHLGWNWKAIGGKNPDWSQAIPGGPLAHGFDYYFGDTVINFPPYAWIENDRVLEIPTLEKDTSLWKPIKEGKWECRPGPMVEGWDPYENIPETTRRGVKFIHEQAASEEPFFLYFAYPSPHAPIIPNDAFDGKSEAGPYGDFVYETDHSIGQLLTALEESGQAENTLVIFSADNGPENYAHERKEKFGHWSSFPLKGLKRHIYEGGHRVPFIVSWPGKVPQGVVSDALMSQIDIMATLASVVGYDLPDDQAEDSFDQKAIWTGEISEGLRRSHIHNTWDTRWGIRHEDWVLLGIENSGELSTKQRPSAPGRRNGKPVLYNLAEDLGQENDLLEQYPEKVEMMLGLFNTIRDQGWSSPRLAKE